MKIFALLLLVGLASAAIEQPAPAATTSYLNVYAGGFQPEFLQSYENQRYSYYFGRHNLPDIYQGPVIAVIQGREAERPDQGRERVYNAFYLDNGLRSISDYQNFQQLHQYLRGNPHLSGVVLPYSGLNSNHELLQGRIQNLWLPENFRLDDLVRDLQYQHVPVIYIAPREGFTAAHFTGLSQVARYVISENYIDPVPYYGSQNYQQEGFQNYQASGLQNYQASGLQNYQPSGLQNYQPSGLQNYQRDGIRNIFQRYSQNYNQRYGQNFQRYGQNYPIGEYPSYGQQFYGFQRPGYNTRFPYNLYSRNVDEV